MLPTSLIKKTTAERNELIGSCELEFIVDKDGKTGSFKSLSVDENVNLKLTRIVAEILKNGPTWKPATQNGQPVSSYQQFSFKFK